MWQWCAAMISWVGCLLKDSKHFILFGKNSQLLLKIYVIPIHLSFIYMVALNLLVNNQLNLSLRHIIVTLIFRKCKKSMNSKMAKWPIYQILFHKKSSLQDLFKITLIKGWLSYHLLCYFMHPNFSKLKHNMLIHPV